ncbi:MAG: (Fe-S)-binding protein [Thermacetogeniaceae bacterium]
MLDKALIIEYLDRCSKCGSCQAVCPLYIETRTEPFVARGKIFLLKNYLEGKISLSPKMKEIMSLCLLCKACTYQCPNKIPVDELVISARKEIAEKKGLNFVKKNVFQHLLKNNGRLSIAAKLVYLYQRSGLQWVIRRSGILNILGKELSQKERLLPPMAGIPFRLQAPRHISCREPKLKVAYYAGCLTNYVFPNIGHAILKILQRQQLEILIPEQWCCGIPALASGDEQTAAELAKKNVASFNSSGVDAIITDCASCGHMLRKYADFLVSAEAQSFSAKVYDLSEFLDKVIDFRVGERGVPLTVTYHDPCHLKRGQGVYQEPRRLLGSITQLNFVEMKDADRCCGSAGSFNLEHYKLASQIGNRKIQNILQTGADVVVTACPSCMIQLSHHLELNNSKTKVAHLAEILSMTYGNS